MRTGGDAGSTGEMTDPLAAVKASQATGNDTTSIIVLENFHRFLSSVEIIQAIASQIHAGKQTRSILVILSPQIDLPPELEKLFVVVEHAMPDREQLKEIAKGIATEESELPSGIDLDRVLDAAGGLTRAEAESAFSLSLVRHGELKPNVIWELKAQMLKKSGLLEMYRGDANFDSLGGLDSLKSFCKRSLGRSGNVNARGAVSYTHLTLPTKA